MNQENLQLETDGGIAVVTINRPQALNALNPATLQELQQVFDALAADDKVQVVILTGSGEKAFVAGADIAAMQSLSALQARRFATLGQQLMRSIESAPQPVIAAVNGFALGGGCELALACDIRLAAETARFGQPEVNLGIIPGFGGTQRLARLIGKGRAMELLLTGAMIDGGEAHRLGLVNRVVAAADLLPAARALAEQILAKGPCAVRFIKEAVHNGLEMDLERANRYETELFGLCFASPEQQEGMQAFLEKRPANFRRL